MAFTRFSSDRGVQEKKIEESVFSGMYALNTPGNGLYNPYIQDVHIRLQKWGGNLHANAIDIERTMKKTEPVNYPTASFSVDETRTTFPAWKYRNKEQHLTTYFKQDPRIAIPFHHNLNTRMLEKDYYNKNKTIL
jgi:hypothetical protein